MTNPWFAVPVLAGVVFALSFVVGAYVAFRKEANYQVSLDRYNAFTHERLFVLIGICGALAAAIVVPDDPLDPRLSGIGLAIIFLLMVAVILAWFYLQAFNRAPKTTDQIVFRSPLWIGVYGSVFGLCASAGICFLAGVVISAATLQPMAPAALPSETPEPAPVEAH